MIRKILFSLVLGFLSCELIGAMDKLPYSPIRDLISDVLSLPGGLIASPFYPEGVHTGHGAPNWAIICVLGNNLFYSGLWFFAFLGLQTWRSKRL